MCSWENLWFPLDFPLSQPIEPTRHCFPASRPGLDWRLDRPTLAARSAGVVATASAARVAKLHCFFFFFSGWWWLEHGILGIVIGWYYDYCLIIGIVGDWNIHLIGLRGIPWTKNKTGHFEPQWKIGRELDWLAFFFLFHNWECRHPNWRTHIFRRGWNHQSV